MRALDMHQRRTILAAIAGLLLVAASPVQAADTPTPNDTARFLAGMPPADDSPLAPLSKDRSWQEHARVFNAAFQRVEQSQLARIRAWSSSNITEARPTLFYMFSGPDFLYANAFYPKAKTYVLAGLEPVGAVPDLTTLRGSVPSELGKLRYSLSSILSLSFFITKQMKSDLHTGRVNGTLPILYVFLARSGYAIREVTPIKLDSEGQVQEADAGRGSAAPGVKIVFAGSDGEARTLYYFSTNLADDGVKSSGFLKFCATLAPGDSLVKSASYLLHSGGFSKVREFLLANSAAMVQDDSGIPLTYYDPRKWDLHPFGRYLGPISIFPGAYQARYAELFRKARPIDFGIGYRHRSAESNLLLVVKKSQDAEVEGSAAPADGASTSSTGEAPPPARSRQPSHSRRAPVQSFFDGFWRPPPRPRQYR
jgi:hypothetical protein